RIGRSIRSGPRTPRRGRRRSRPRADPRSAPRTTVTVPRMADDTNDVLLVESHGAVRLLTLNRPDAFNATNEELHGALANVWTRLAPAIEMLARVTTAAARAFSGGGDLNLLDRMVHDTDLRAAIM